MSSSSAGDKGLGVNGAIVRELLVAAGEQETISPGPEGSYLDPALVSQTIVRRLSKASRL